MEKKTNESPLKAIKKGDEANRDQTDSPTLLSCLYAFIRLIWWLLVFILSLLLLYFVITN
ncbi:MAG: hypothetical protein HFE54_05085 [Turicibacter sp.]|uniref:Uncharacterized protein n=1 Tax=Turicibacter faecis TaxID=2963365 RepID=A0ABN6ZB81_9FIRM|nr:MULTISPECIES: hypothetical protein [unclassified Turicibacter]MCI8700751.1 hypothetical protein [Turicibacter sp.]BEH91104.1 hypothetical protein T23_12060 [Turicibacter sp. TC023]MCI9351301.1 hypothetical protein [Turicibacter sp.]MCU7204198.1 hypothetical protein [Turicibacter sp. TA25]MCU7209421.1 hypothetical protein [Turicibacter sp. 1E2]